MLSGLYGARSRVCKVKEALHPLKITQALGSRGTGVPRNFLAGFLKVMEISSGIKEAKGIPGHGIIHSKAQSEEYACYVQRTQKYP